MWAHRNNHSYAFVEVDYGDQVPCTSGYDEVVLVDFSFTPEEMYNLSEEIPLTWIDHHALRDKEVEQYFEERKKDPVPGIRRPGLGACALVAKHYRMSPRRVGTIIAEYDTYAAQGTDEWETVHLPFMAMLVTEEYGPKAKIWEDLRNEAKLDYFLELGATVLKANRQTAAKALAKHSFVREILGLQCRVINTEIVFSAVDTSKYKENALIYYFRSGDNIYCHLRRLHGTRNLAKLARELFGENAGGHPFAAGSGPLPLDVVLPWN